MKQINTYISLLMVVSLIFGCYSCDNFDDLNTNPDTTTKVPASMLCTNSILRITKFSGDAKAYIATNALSKYVAYASEGQMAEQYDKLGAGSFGYYAAWPNMDDMVKYAAGGPYQNAYIGVSHFLRAYMLYQMTMSMGDIPDSEAGKADSDGNYRPKYDAQESVFISILNHLDEANKAFGSGGTDNFSGDPVYNGSCAQWQKATNAFALKVLMTLSRKEGVNTLNIKQRFADIVNTDLIMKSNSDNFITKYADETGKFHPLYNGSKFTLNTMLSNTLVEPLKALNDYRLFYYGEPSKVKIDGGMLATDMNAYVGVDVEIPYNEVNNIFNSKDYSQINNRYHLEKAPEPLVLIGYAEQQLILAEAVIRGWIGGSAEEYYKSGVKAALSFVKDAGATYAHGSPITDAYIDNYFTGEAAFKSAERDRLEQIWLQRYLLHFMQDATSSYYEYRRTTYPAFPSDPATSLNENKRGAIPLRWLYPSGETTTNRDNLDAALKSQYDGYDDINKQMWLLK